MVFPEHADSHNLYKHNIVTYLDTGHHHYKSYDSRYFLHNLDLHT